MRHRIGVGLAALLVAVSAPATECFWTGAKDGTSLHDPANWADGRGAPLAACPGADDDVVFTNTAPLALTPAQTVKFHGMRFLGAANVEVTKTTSRDNILCSGGVTNDSRAQVKFSYVSRFKGDYVDSFVGEGAKTSFDISVYPESQTVIGKSGPGEMVLCESAGTNPGFPDNLKVRLCGGTLGLGRASRLIDGTNYGSAPRRGVRIEFFGACGAACVTFPVEDVVLSNDCALVETDVTGHAHSLQGPVGRTLTLAGTWQDTVFTGFIGGALVVRWMPSNDAVFTLSGSTSTGGGSLYVDRGVFRLVDGAVYVSPWHFRVAAGAQYRNETPHALCAPKGNIYISRSADRKPLYLAENAVLRGAVGNTFMLDGKQLAPGLYHRGNCDWIDGDGYVLVPGEAEPSGTATATWTGNGGAETSVLNPANWGAADNATLPDLTSGALEATFPVGARATVPEQTEVAFKKLVVSSDSPFVLAGGAGARVRLGSGGLVLPKKAGGACTIETPLLLVADQTWALTNDLTLAAGARVAALSNTSLTRIGTGTWVVDADHNHFATLVLSGPEDKKFYGVRTFFRADGASGDEQTVVKVLSAEQTPTFGTGSVLAQVRPAFDAIPNPFMAFPAGETVVAGACVLTDNGNLNAQNFRLEAGAQVRFRGGLSYMGANNNSAFSASSTATTGRIGVTVEEVPAEVTRLLLLTSSYTWNLPPSALDTPHPAFDWRFRVGGNKFARGLIVGATNATLYTEAPNFMARPTNTSCAGNLVRGIRFVRAGTWDLCGVDQEVDVLFSERVPGVVTSATDAVVRLADNQITTNLAGNVGGFVSESYLQIHGATQVVDSISFRGGAGLVKTGTLTHYSMGASTSTGRVEVTAGRLVFTKAGETLAFDDTTHPRGQAGEPFTSYVATTAATWPAARRVRVSGGVLELRHGKVFSQETEVELDGTGVIELPAGVVQRVGGLTLDGVRKPSGVYDRVHGGGHLAGDGRLIVGTPGTLLLVR